MMKQNVFHGVTESEIFENRDLLDPSEKVPREKIVGREEQIEELTYLMKQLAEGNSAKNFIVTGDTGVGKTMITKLVLEDFQKAMNDEKNQVLDVIYTENNENERSVLLEISEELELDFRGRSSLKTYYNLMEEKIVQQDKKVILVIDEIDRLFQESKNKDHGNSLLKQLLDTRKNIKEQERGYLQIVGITNDASVIDKLNSVVKSRTKFKKNEVSFPSYNAMQLKEILEERAEDAFKENVLDDGVIPKIASIVARKEGDARTAIEMLDGAAEIVDKQEDQHKVTKEHVDMAEYNLEEGRIEKKVEQLSQHQQIVFLSALILQKRKPTTGELFTEYEKICQIIDTSSLTQRRVVDLINKLDNMGLITASKKKGVRGNTREIRVSFNEEMSRSLIEQLETKHCIEGEFDIKSKKQKVI